MKGQTLILAGLSSALLGFSTPALYPESVGDGGGGGRFFTGSHRDGFGCGVCHESDEHLRVELRGVPSRYEAGATYTVEVSWPGAPGTVSLVTEWVDSSGYGAGELTVPPEDILEEHERCSSGSRAAQLYEAEFDRTIIGMSACGASLMRMQWTAPEDPQTGPVWLHLGAVASDESDDPSGDAVHKTAVEIRSSAATSGCRSGGTPPPILLLGLLLAARRRKTR